eukprot:6956071-Pyramimonas_sp.AAC.1
MGAALIRPVRSSYASRALSPGNCCVVDRGAGECGADSVSELAAYAAIFVQLKPLPLVALLGGGYCRSSPWGSFLHRLR